MNKKAINTVEFYKNSQPNNSGLMMMIWVLGTEFKKLSGFYPHLIIEGDSGTGKSSLIDSFSKADLLTNISGNLFTPFAIRRLGNNSFKPIAVDDVFSIGENYFGHLRVFMNYAYTSKTEKYGYDKEEFISCAPVLLSGHKNIDMPDTLINKVIKIKLEQFTDSNNDWSTKKWPKKKWKAFIDDINQQDFYEKMNTCTLALSEINPLLSETMVRNQALMLTIWIYMRQFLGLSNDNLKNHLKILA